MAIDISGPKKLVSTPVLIAGAGGVVGLIGGDMIGGAIAGAIPEIDITNPGHMVAVKAGSKLGLGLVGAYLAAKPGEIGTFATGLAFGGLIGALGDLANYGLAMAQTPTISTGATAAERFGASLVRKSGFRPMRPRMQMTQRYSPAMSTGASQLEILPRD